MKIFFLLLVSILGFCNSTLHRGELRVVNNENNATINNITHSETKNLSVIAKKSDSKIDVYEDNILVSSYFYDKGLLLEEVFSFTSSNSEEATIKYYYKENGEYDKLEIIKGQEISSDKWLDRLMLDFQFQYEVLKSKNIQLPLATEILSNEVRDLSNVLSIAEVENDFKKETKTTKNRKIIKFIGFNKNIRLYPSYITMFIPDNTFIKDYELTLVDNYPHKEVYKTDGGELTREYFYNDKKIVKVLNTFKGKDEELSFERKFNYYDSM